MDLERLRGEKNYLEDEVIPALRAEIERLQAFLDEALEYGVFSEERRERIRRALNAPDQPGFREDQVQAVKKRTP